MRRIHLRGESVRGRFSSPVYLALPYCPCPLKQMVKDDLGHDAALAHLQSPSEGDLLRLRCLRRGSDLVPEYIHCHRMENVRKDDPE